MLHRPQFTKLRSPERSPILTRRSRSHERSPNSKLVAKELRNLKHRSLEIPHTHSWSPDNKRRSNTYEGSSESPDRLISTPIPIPIKLPPSHSASSSEITPDKSPPQGEDTTIQVHVKTESEDSLGGSEAVTPKLEEPIFPEQIRPERSTSATGEVEQLPPLFEETSLSPDISRSLKVAKGTPNEGSEVSRSLDEELFKMLDSKEGSVKLSLESYPQEATVKNQVEGKEKSEVAKDIAEHEDIKFLDELDKALEAAEEETDEDGEYEDEDEDEEERKDVDRANVVKSREKEVIQEATKPVVEEPNFRLDSETTMIESEQESGTNGESKPLGVEHPINIESKSPSVESKPSEETKKVISSIKVESEPPPQIKLEDAEQGCPQIEVEPPEVETERNVTVEVEHPIVTFTPPIEKPEPEQGEVATTQVHSKPQEVGSDPSEVKRESQTAEVEIGLTEAEPKQPEAEHGPTQFASEPPSIQPEPLETEHEPLKFDSNVLNTGFTPPEDDQESPQDKQAPHVDKHEKSPEDEQQSSEAEPESLPHEEPCVSSETKCTVEESKSSAHDLELLTTSQEPEIAKQTSLGPPEPSTESQEPEPIMTSSKEDAADDGNEDKLLEGPTIKSAGQVSSPDDEKKVDDESSKQGNLTAQDSVERLVGSV